MKTNSMTINIHNNTSSFSTVVINLLGIGNFKWSHRNYGFKLMLALLSSILTFRSCQRRRRWRWNSVLSRTRSLCGMRRRNGREHRQGRGHWHGHWHGRIRRRKRLVFFSKPILSPNTGNLVPICTSAKSWYVGYFVRLHYIVYNV
jgi:hypothetical protein